MRDTKVALKVCNEYDGDMIAGKLKEGFDLLGGLSNYIKPGHTVLIKPDLYNCSEPNQAKTTNPNVVSALAELVYKIGATCIIADSPKGDFKQSNLDNAYVKTQMLQVSNNGHAMLNINDDIAFATNPNGEHCRNVYVIDAVNDADVIINVGKFRCDKNLGLIGCSQNIFGLIPGKFKELIKSRCHTLKSYYNYIHDIYEVFEDKIVLNILDGIVASEVNNDPRILNTILIGENPYAVDSVALKVINQNPQDSLLLNESVRRGKFSFDLELVGDNIEPLICSDFHYTSFGENVKSASMRKFRQEYNSYQKRPVIPSNLCKGCKICIANCPMKAISMQSGQFGEYAKVDYDRCITCLKCVDNCPYKVIKTKTPIKYRPIDRMIKKSLRERKD